MRKINYCFKNIGLVAGVLASIICASCAQDQLISQSSQFNRATAQTNLEDILINGLRASKQFPMQFTRIVKYTGEGMAKGSLSPDFPFGINAPRIFNVKPVLNWSSGVSSMEYGSLSNEEGLIKLTDPLTYEEIDRYLSTGTSIPGIIIAEMSFSSIEVSEEVRTAIVSDYHEKCDQNKTIQVCQQIEEIKKECPDNAFEGQKIKFGYSKIKDKKEYTRVPNYFYIYNNDATTKCGYLGFRVFFKMMTMNGFTTTIKRLSKNILEKNEAGKKVAVEKTSHVPAAYFGSDRVQTARESSAEKLKGSGYAEFTIKFRSPKTMIGFLGDLIRLQNFSPEHYLATVTINGSEVPLILVKTDSIAQEETAIQIRDDEGQVFYVPKPDYGSPTSHRTLEALSIISDFMNARISKKALPEPSNVVFSLQ